MRYLFLMRFKIAQLLNKKLANKDFFKFHIFFEDITRTNGYLYSLSHLK